MLPPLSVERAGVRGPTLGTPLPLPLRRVHLSSSPSHANALAGRLKDFEVHVPSKLLAFHRTIIQARRKIAGLNCLIELGFG